MQPQPRHQRALSGAHETASGAVIESISAMSRMDCHRLKVRLLGQPKALLADACATIWGLRRDFAQTRLRALSAMSHFHPCTSSMALVEESRSNQRRTPPDSRSQSAHHAHPM